MLPGSWVSCALDITFGFGRDCFEKNVGTLERECFFVFLLEAHKKGLLKIPVSKTFTLNLQDFHLKAFFLQPDKAVIQKYISKNNNMKSQAVTTSFSKHIFMNE